MKITLKLKLRRSVKVFTKRYIRPKFQSCLIELKLKIQSLLTLLIPTTLSLSIMDHKWGSFCGELNGSTSAKQDYWTNFHIYGPNLSNWVFLESGGSGGFVFSILTESDDFEILALFSAWKKLWRFGVTSILEIFSF